jgi:hypothetical protein
MQVIPLRAIPSQIVSISLAGQPCRIAVYQKSTGLFCDLYANDALIIGGVICLNANLIVRDAYLGFIGDLSFFDTQGEDDPDYTGLGSRWLLSYVELSDMPA